MKNVTVQTVLSIAIVIAGGCAKPASTTNLPAALESFTMDVKGLSGETIASGTLSLPSDIRSRTRFHGSCKIRVMEVPAQPSRQTEYALLCLSQNNGVLSGTVRDGVVRIELHPQVDDNTVYLEGKLNGQSFKGKCFYQSYAGYKEFGAFEAKTETNTP